MVQWPWPLKWGSRKLSWHPVFAPLSGQAFVVIKCCSVKEVLLYTPPLQISNLLIYNSKACLYINEPLMSCWKCLNYSQIIKLKQTRNHTIWVGFRYFSHLQFSIVKGMHLFGESFVVILTRNLFIALRMQLSMQMLFPIICGAGAQHVERQLIRICWKICKNCGLITKPSSLLNNVLLCLYDLSRS